MGCWVDERRFDHDDKDRLRQRLDNEAAQFKDSSMTHETRHTTAAAPTVQGEHTHHHVHEKVQPIIQKETIAPEVVHTTVPIHETHHASTQHHGISALPPKTMDEFTAQGGGNILDGEKSGVAREKYEGAPRKYNKDLETTVEQALHPHGQHGAGSTSTGSTGLGSGGVGSTGAGSTGLGSGGAGSTGAQQRDY